MNIEESIRQFLPQYLSSENQKKLIEELKDFPNNLDSRFYTRFLKNEKIVFSFKLSIIIFFEC